MKKVIKVNALAGLVAGVVLSTSAVNADLSLCFSDEKDSLIMLEVTNEYFTQTNCKVSTTTKDEFGTEIQISHCAIVEKYNRSDKDANEMIRIYSEVFYEDRRTTNIGPIKELYDTSIWFSRSSQANTAIEVQISRGFLPTKVDVTNTNLQTVDKNLKISTDTKSIVAFVNNYLNDYSNPNTKTSRNRLMLFYSYLIANNVASLPFDTNECEFKINMFVNPAIDFVKLFVKNTTSEIKLMQLLSKKQHELTTEYLLSDKKTKKIFDFMKSYDPWKHANEKKLKVIL